MDWKVGDKVRLKSGGPAMTVTGADSTQVWLTWFNANKSEYSSYVLPRETTEAATSNNSSYPL
jgi:uncharacterized protein YodC (DUF2158 family)